MNIQFGVVGLVNKQQIAEITTKQSVQYCGKSRRGKIQLRFGAKRAFGSGRLRPSEGSSSEDVSADMQEYMTSDYVPDPNADSDFNCICAKTGKLYEFTGQVKFLASNLTGTADVGTLTEEVQQVEAVENELKPSSNAGPSIQIGDSLNIKQKDGDGSAPAQTDCLPLISSGEAQTASSPSKKARKKRDIAAEIELLVKLRQAGLDPGMRMRHITLYYGRSVPTIYRKISQNKFPPPIKEGKDSIWPMSLIESVMAGTWVPSGSDK